MANIVALASLCLIFDIISFSLLSHAQSSCNGTCKTLDDCSGQLICFKGKCNDDPEVGTHICIEGGSSTPVPNNDYFLSSCNGPCRTLDDCYGQLICINGKCNDDPDVGTHICRGRNPTSRPKDKCLPSGTLACKDTTHLTYTCSPTVTSSTKAFLTNNISSKGVDSRNRSECDEKYHANKELVVALSTGWYKGGSRCGKMIKIKASDGRSVVAKVVDECDSKHGCDQDHAGQPPCRSDIVDGSDAVWSALGLDKNEGVIPITWSLA